MEAYTTPVCVGGCNYTAEQEIRSRYTISDTRKVHVAISWILKETRYSGQSTHPKQTKAVCLNRVHFFTTGRPQWQSV